MLCCIQCKYMLTAGDVCSGCHTAAGTERACCSSCCSSPGRTCSSDSVSMGCSAYCRGREGRGGCVCCRTRTGSSKWLVRATAACCAGELVCRLMRTAMQPALAKSGEGYTACTNHGFNCTHCSILQCGCAAASAGNQPQDSPAQSCCHRSCLLVVPLACLCCRSRLIAIANAATAVAVTVAVVCCSPGPQGLVIYHAVAICALLSTFAACFVQLCHLSTVLT